MSKKEDKKRPEYYDMLKPIESMEAAETKVRAFLEEVGELRDKHMIPDVHVIVQIVSRDMEGNAGDQQSSVHIGSRNNAVQMLATALGSWRQMEWGRSNSLRRMGGPLAHMDPQGEA